MYGVPSSAVRQRRDPSASATNELIGVLRVGTSTVAAVELVQAVPS